LNKWDDLRREINLGAVEASTAEALRLVEAGEDPLTIFLEGIEPCLSEIGDRFGRLEIFLPELMLSADAVKAIQVELLPMLEADGSDYMKKGRVVIGTIFGDIHDIGKNIVSVLLQVSGFEVRDLGVAVPAQDVIDSAKDFDADIIGISGLMMPSLPYMRDAISLVKENPELADRFRIFVGGGPVTREWAEMVGADGFAEDAVSAVEEATRLMKLVKGESV
jgi:methanogenic corrinoid protein MtbC1|tara:strand:+ start:5798 stop:6460 length:663 start_codon:yes stop_codon:yes gene_type:complete